MARPHSRGAATPSGVGLGLRIEFAGELFADETAPVDFLEIHPENYVDRGGAHITMLERACERFSFVTHGLTMGFANVEAPSGERLAKVRSLLDRVGSNLHSDHFCFASSHGRFAHELLPVPFDAKSRDVAVERLQRMRDALDRPIAIENLSYYVPRSHDPLDEIEILAEIVERADAKLLLDVNNVVVNAHNHHFDPRAWLDRVPYDRVAQLHVAGHLIRPDGLRIDTHGARVDDEVSTLLGEVLRRTGPVPVLLERDSEMPAYAELRAELVALRAIYDQAMETPEDRMSTVVFSRRVPEVFSGVTTARVVDPRFDEPSELEAFETAVVDHLVAPTKGTLGAGLVAERWDLYRRMTRGRLDDMFRAAFPRTRARIGNDAYDAYSAELLASEPLSPIFWRAGAQLASFIEARVADDLARDLCRFELAEWRVRHAPFPAAVESNELDFEGVPVVNPARVSFEARYAVHVAVEAGSDITPAEGASWIVVFRKRDDKATSVSLNPLARAILERFEAGDRSVREAVVSAAESRGVAIDQAFLDALAETLAQWIELGLLVGVAARR